MNNERRQAITEGLSKLKDHLLQIEAIKRIVEDELDHIPDMELYEDLRENYSDAADALESVSSDLYDIVKKIDLEILGDNTSKPRPEPEPDMDYIPLPQEDRPGFFSKLQTGLFGAHVLSKAEQQIEQERLEREERRRDDIFWQDAARRKDPAYEENDEDDF